MTQRGQFRMSLYIYGNVLLMEALAPAAIAVVGNEPVPSALQFIASQSSEVLVWVGVSGLDDLQDVGAQAAAAKSVKALGLSPSRTRWCAIYSILKPLFGMVWNAHGYDGSRNYNDQGVWVGQP